MNKLLLLAVAFAAITLIGYGQLDAPAEVAPASVAVAGDNDEVFARAFENRARKLQVEGRGIVTKILPDDNDGSRHQRFIVRLNSGLSLLIAHNLDLAPRVAGLRVGNVISFSGEYEWNSKGGVVHWTHRDPHGRHPAGWLRHGGQLFQ